MIPSGNTVEERRHLALHGLRRALVQLHEQRDDAAGVQVRLDRLEELLRVERRGALHPRVERVRRDRVELLLRRQQEVPRVVDRGRAPSGCRRRRSSRRRSTSRRRCGTSGSISAMVTRSTRGSMLTAPAVTPAPQPMTSTDRGCRRNQRREVAEHPLQPHVLRLARRLDLAGVVVAEHAVRQPRDRHRRVQPLADVDESRRPGPARSP